MDEIAQVMTCVWLPSLWRKYLLAALISLDSSVQGLGLNRNSLQLQVEFQHILLLVLCQSCFNSQQLPARMLNNPEGKVRLGGTQVKCDCP